MEQFINERKAKDKHEQNKLVKEFDLYAMETLGTESNIKGHKALRLKWDCDKDILQFDLKITSNNCLQIVPNKMQHIECACIFRLIRDCKPVAIKALFQELCTQKVGWDDEINESQRER